MTELKNELLKNIKTNFMVILTNIDYTLFKNKFVSSSQRFSAVQWSRGYQESAVKKQLMYLNIYITGCYVHICFILIYKNKGNMNVAANCDINLLAEAAIVWCSLKGNAQFLFLCNPPKIRRFMSPHQFSSNKSKNAN